MVQYAFNVIYYIIMVNTKNSKKRKKQVIEEYFPILHKIAIKEIKVYQG